MKTFDLHQDLLTHLRFRNQLGQTHQTDWSDIEQSEIDLVVATAFPFPPDDNQLHPSAPALITEELELYQDFLAANSDTWQLVTSSSDLSSAKQKLILHIEGLNLFDGSASAWQQLNAWYEQGVRSIGTHWNIQNKLGGGTLQPDVPLTELGYEVISYLEENQMVFDLAHMGRTSFNDAAAVATRPLYVSHGNADALCPNVRNYTDEQLKQIAETDGVIGVFFAQTFVTGKERSANVDDVLAHISYIRDLIGVRHIAIGSDWGGIVTGGMTNLAQVKDLPNLYQALDQAGYTEEDIAAIAHRNAARVLTTHLHHTTAQE